MKKINFSRLDRRLNFGHIADTQTINPNTGEPLRKFTTDTTVWGGKLSMTFNQQVTLAGAGITNATVFVIRHNPSIQNDMLIQDGNDFYNIDHIEFDDNFDVPGFDSITCHSEVTKHG